MTDATSTKPQTNPRARLCVMLSGSGRTLMNLLDVIERGELDAEIALVIASRQCPGEERARQRGLTTIIEKGNTESGAIAMHRLDALLAEHSVTLIALAGYLKLVHYPPRFEGRVVNIHPALLPRFGGPGMFGERVHAAVLAAGVRESGCTVHLCDNRYDTGPIILQRSCPVLGGDTPETLAARVFKQECIAYPKALQLLIDQGVPVDG